MLNVAPSTTTIALVGVASFLIVLALIVKLHAGNHKEAEKCDKAQIMKRLLALSEHEDMQKGIPRHQSVSQRSTPRRRVAAATTPSSRTVRPDVT